MYSIDENNTTLIELGTGYMRGILMK